MRSLYVLLGAVAIHMVGFGAVIPSIPYVLKELGGDAQLQGVLVSIYSIMQMATAPIWGYVSDRVGRSVVAAAGLALAAVGHLSMYFARDLWIFTLGRVVAGVGGGTLPALQAMIADMSPADRRASSMALFGVAFGVGFVLGPAVGGVLAAVEVKTPFIAAALLSLTSALLVGTIPNTKAAVSYRLDLGLGLLALPILLLNIGFSIFEGLLSYFAAFAASFTPTEVGLLLALSGAAAAAAQPIVKRLEGGGSGRGAAYGLAAAAVGLVLITSSLWARPLIYIGVVVATVGQVVASSFIFATVSKRAGGLGLGALQSAGAFGRIVGPVLGGFLYTHAGPAAPFATAALITLLTIPLLFRVVERVAV